MNSLDFSEGSNVCCNTEKSDDENFWNGNKLCNETGNVEKKKIPFASRAYAQLLDTFFTFARFA